MAAVDTVARAHYQRQAALGESTIRRAQALWRGLDVQDLFGTWQTMLPALTKQVAAGQMTAAADSNFYVTQALAAQDVTPTPRGQVNPAALAGIASDGRSIEGLLWTAPLTVRDQLAVGAPVLEALLSGWTNLAMHIGTQIADAGRAADQTALVATPQARTWVRMIEAGACSRCAVLAGREYKWKADFLRHPRCRCRAIPSAEAGSDLTTDPKAYFDSLSEAEQNRIFTNAGAEAIRNGADISQVVNARRGMYSATAYGRNVFATREGVTRRGRAGQSDLIRRNGGLRLMPEQIFRDATSREDAIRLLRAYGYII